MATATYDLIASQTLGSAASSITFSSIAASWTDLRLVLVGTASTGNYLAPNMQFNGVTTTTYSVTWLWGNGTTTGSSSQTNQTGMSFNSQNSITSSIPGFLSADIFSYAGSTYKTVLTTASVDLNGSGEVERAVNLWRSTAAITSLTLNGSFGTGFNAQLYGIKAA